MQKDSSKTATITAIERGAVHDGQGIRTIIFFKGCPLRCRWCHNPETLEAKPQLMYIQSDCMMCLVCVEVCPLKAVSATNKKLLTDYTRCTACGKCAKICPTGARKIIGERKTVDQLIDMVLRDRIFYKNSNGGVTLSGGEVLLYTEFAMELLKRVQAAGINTTIETCGYVLSGKFISLLQYVDMLFFDIKHIDAEKHKLYTGRSNELILKNLVLAKSIGKDIVIRYPCIPGVNDDEKTVKAICGLCRQHNIKNLHILPFHQVGDYKWDAIGRNYFFKDAQEMNVDQIQKVLDICKSTGVNATVGGSELR
jgi:pyruvate formate lyase activating enzyme